jgi:hypothetical protein
LKQFFIFSALILLSCFFVKAQNEQAQYLEAKRLFNNDQFSSAKGAFGALTDDPYFGNYASFYFGMSAYKHGDTRIANDMWSQLLIKSPKWKGRAEVLFWLSYSNLENGNHDKGINFTKQLSEITNSSNLELEMYKKYISILELEKIADLYEAHESSRSLAFVFAMKLNNETYEQRDFEKINQLNAKWRFNDNEQSLDDLIVIKKDKYRIGVLLPFMFDQSKPEFVLQNNLVMGLYQGMKLAVEDLNREEINLELVTLDTKRDETTTLKVLNSLPDSYLDLIVGPLYPEPVNVAKDYSKMNQVNMINPLSSNSEVIADNQFGFLFKPTYESMAKALAKQADQEFYNRNAMIFYEDNSRDSLFASVYKQEIEEYGFNVVWFQKLTNVNAKGVLDTLIAQYEVFYTQSEADSISKLDKRFVKERRIRRDEERRLEKYAKGESKWDSLFYLPVSYNEDSKPVTYYENFFYIKTDSIGHILGATRKNYLANNLISAVETMGDSTALYGYGDWLDFTMVAYNQLERIGVSMVYPDYVAYSDTTYKAFEKKFLSKYKAMPSSFQLQGYELMMQIGKLMDSHGVYFQNELRRGGYYEGLIYQGIKYGSANDNQIVPIVKFEDAELKIVNKNSYED